MGKSIILDASHLKLPVATGVERYVDELYPRLLQQLSDHQVRVVLVGHREQSPISLPEGVVWHYSPYRTGWGQWVVPRLVRELEADAYFTPSGILPLTLAVPGAMTIHDVSVHHFSRAYRMSQRLRLRYLVPRAARRAALVLTPSQYVADEVVQRYRVPRERVQVTLLALPVVEAAEPLEVPGLDPHLPVVLVVGRIEHKKNLRTLIRAAASLQPRFPVQLVLAGADGYGSAAVRKEAADHSQVHTVFPGYISEGERRFLYGRATVVAVPGAHEGFGLPILEGFAAGVPVLAARAGALPEVAEKAAYLVAPYSTSEWAEALYTSCTDAKLRAQYVQAGHARLAQFSWEETTARTADALLTMLLGMSSKS